MLLAGICENDSVQNRYYKQVTERYLKNKEGIQYSIKSFLNSEELLRAVNDNKFDLIVLDIEIGKEVNGIDIAKTINIVSPSTKIIFVSGNAKYYPDVYNAKHSYFIVKDKIDFLLPKALSICLENYYENKANETLALKYKGEETIIPKLNILYIEKQLRLSKFCLINNQETKVYMDFSTVLRELNSDEFMQIHRSFIVNLNYVKTIRGNTVVLSNGRQLTVGPTYHKLLREKLQRLKGNQ